MRGQFSRRQVIDLRRSVRLLGSAILFAVVLSGCASTRQPAVTINATLRIGTGTRAGAYYPLGEALSTVWAEAIPTARSEVLQTSGSPENLDLLFQGKVDVAMVNSSYLYHRLTKEPDGARLRNLIRGVTYMHPNAFHLLVRRGSGIAGAEGLRGRRVAVGPTKSVSVENALELLAVFGLTAADVELQSLEYEEMALTAREHLVDAFLVAGGVPTPAITELLQVAELELVPLDPEPIVKQYPWYSPLVIPPGAYPGLTGEVRSVSVSAILVARAGISAELVYQTIRAMYSNRWVLILAHPAAGAMVMERALLGITGVVDLHPGAARYLREAGVVQ